MNAQIIAVGSELLTPARLDTNSLFLTGKLNGLGVELVRKSVIGDDRARLCQAVKAALAECQVVLVTGGLGPTEDDVTREAIADALARALERDATQLARLEERFRKLGRTMAPNNRKQADVIAGAVVLENPNGTAPGQWIEQDGVIVMLLPGPPRELEPMFERQCMPRLEAALPKQVIRTLFYRVTGIGESDLDARIAPVYTRYANPVTTVLAAPGDIQLHFRARCETAEQAEGLLAEVAGQIEPLLGGAIYSANGDALEAVVGRLLAERSASLAVAESCTGGMLAERITDVAGSSAYFVGGVTAYSNSVKTALLGVDARLLDTEGAVSAPVAEAMARGVRERLGATYGLSITGVAGPEGGTESKPVGTVWIGASGPERTTAWRFRFPSGRSRVRGFAVQTALDLLRRELTGADAPILWKS